MLTMLRKMKTSAQEVKEIDAYTAALLAGLHNILDGLIAHYEKPEVEVCATSKAGEVP